MEVGIEPQVSVMLKVRSVTGDMTLRTVLNDSLFPMQDVSVQHVRNLESDGVGVRRAKRPLRQGRRPGQVVRPPRSLPWSVYDL